MKEVLSSLCGQLHNTQFTHNALGNQQYKKWLHGHRSLWNSHKRNEIWIYKICCFNEL